MAVVASQAKAIGENTKRYRRSRRHQTRSQMEEKVTKMDELGLACPASQITEQAAVV
jgi:hypothetical protein